MSDNAIPPFGPEPQGAAHDGVRDALPAFLHGRVTASARADLERHLDDCTPCDAELALLARVRDAYTADAPAISVDRIAAAVRAATVPPRVAPATPATAPLAPARTVAPRLRTAPAWARRGALRAFAATALLALGSGALYVRQSATPARPDSAAILGHVAPSVQRARTAVADTNQSLLGANFSDLSDTELAAVVAAVDDPAAPVPAAEPAPMSPAGLAPDGE